MKKIWVITSRCCQMFQAMEWAGIILHSLNQHYRMRPRRQKDVQYFCNQHFFKMPKHRCFKEWGVCCRLCYLLLSTRRSLLKHYFDIYITAKGFLFHETRNGSGLAVYRVAGGFWTEKRESSYQILAIDFNMSISIIYFLLLLECVWNLINWGNTWIL